MDSARPSNKEKGVAVKRVLIIAGVLLGLLLLLVPITLRLLARGPEDNMKDLLTMDVREEDGYLLVAADDPKANLVIYPGALVEAESYLYLADRIARHGVNVHIQRMPFNLAILNRHAFLEYEKEDGLPWYLAGHSLGGASAAYVAENHPGELSGLILLAAYVPAGVDLSETSLPVLTITASRDGVIDRQAFEERKTQLPSTALHRVIEGGNHAQFGYYGSQRGDKEATIRVHEQHALIKAHMVNFILDED